VKLPKAWHLPLRAATGAYILNSGSSKRSMKEERAARLHGFATTAHPELKSMDPTAFAKLLSAMEISLGSSLLVPLVPSWLAGAALTAFSAGLMRLYLFGPGLRSEGSLRPTGQGIAISKDVWMLAIGLALILDAASDD
jgi:uncharacterized membrane protein YkgB